MRTPVGRLTTSVVAILVGGALVAASPPAVAAWSSSGRAWDTTMSTPTSVARQAPFAGHVPAWTATLVISFQDPLNGFHPMGITSDGSNYYTTNGGNSGDTNAWQGKANINSSFSDGTSNTILFAEKYAGCGQGDDNGNLWAWGWDLGWDSE